MFRALLSRLNPFRGLSNPREVWAWGMYDLANQSFTLIIITLLFPVYFREVISPDPRRAEALWSALGSGSLLLVVAVSPFLGAIADGRGWKKRLLILTGVLAAALTAGLAATGPGTVLLAAALFFCANVLYQLGENFLASFLPEVATPRNIGRVSATGWAMGYAGALVLLVISAGAIALFGLDKTRWSALFLFAGVWFALGMVPAILILRERPPPADPGPLSDLLGLAVRRVRDTLAHARHFAHLARFLTAFFVYGFGVQTIIYFAGIIANDFGFTEVKLVLFALQLTVTAGVASVVTAMIQDRVGARTMVLISLGVWIATAAGMLALTAAPDPPEWLFWLVGNGVGFGLGGIGTSSRSLVGRFTPVQKSAEFFGLWGMTYKLAGVVGVLAFGQMKAWLGDAPAMIALTAFFVAGLVLTLRVDETAGVRAARRAERDAARPRGRPE
ncbi:MAG: MFS transporter [Phycisphaerales bacterium]|nr:MFS transporter [Phycisphaerales bacterium]